MESHTVMIVLWPVDKQRPSCYGTRVAVRGSGGGAKVCSSTPIAGVPTAIAGVPTAVATAMVPTATPGLATVATATAGVATASPKGASPKELGASPETGAATAVAMATGWPMAGPNGCSCVARTWLGSGSGSGSGLGLELGLGLAWG